MMVRDLAPNRRTEIFQFFSRYIKFGISETSVFIDAAFYTTSFCRTKFAYNHCILFAIHAINIKPLIFDNQILTL